MIPWWPSKDGHHEFYIAMRNTIRFTRNLVVVGVVLFANILSSCSEKETKVEKSFVLLVKVHETDCFSCLQGYYFLNELSEIAETKIVFNGLNEVSIKGFFDANSLNYLLETKDVEIISDENLYEKLNHTATVSEGFLYDKRGEEIFHFQFRMNTDEMKQLESICLKGKTMLEKNELLTLQTNYNNDGVAFYVQGGNYILLNRPLNNCQIFDSKGLLIREIEGRMIDSRQIFPELNEYASDIMGSLETQGQLSASIKDVFLVRNSIWIGCQIPYPVISGNRIEHYSYYMVLSYKLVSQDQSFEVIFDGKTNCVSTISFDQGREGCINALIYRVDGDDHTKNYSYARFKMKDGEMTNVEERVVGYPMFNRNKYLWHAPTLKDGLFNVAFTEYLVDVESDTIFKLPFCYNAEVEDNGGFDMRLSMDASLVDWSYDGTTLGVVYHDKIDDIFYYLLWARGMNDFTKSELPSYDVPVIGYRLQTPQVIRCLDKYYGVHSIVM